MEFKPSFAIQSIFKIEFDDELNEIIRTYERNSEKLFYNSLKPKCIKIFNKAKAIITEKNWETINSFRIEIEALDYETKKILNEVQSNLDIIKNFVSNKIEFLKFIINSKTTNIEK